MRIPSLVIPVSVLSTPDVSSNLGGIRSRRY